jgi:hypothetical protein
MPAFNGFGLILIGLFFVIAIILYANFDPAGALTEYHSLIESQRRAFEILPLLNVREMIVGVGMDRINDLARQVGISIPQGDIDNPWVLMFLILGGGGFVLWLAATGWFFRNLLRGQSLTLRLALIAYFLIASTSDSFGRKDTIYPATIGVIACATASRRLQRTEKNVLASPSIPPERVKWL